MKTKNKSIKLVTKGLIAISASIPAGCNPDNNFIEVHEDIISNDNMAIPIKSIFNQDDWTCIRYINSLTKELIDQQEIAEKFISNPKNFLREAGFNNMNINISEKKIRILSVLADKDIREKLESNDLRGFMNLCKQKGYIENYSGNILKYLNSPSTPASIETASGDNAEILMPIIDCPIIFYVYKVAISPIINDLNMSRQPFFEVLLLNENEKDAYITCEKYIEDEIEIITNFIKEENQHLTNDQMIEITNLLKKNLIHINNTIKMQSLQKIS